MFFRNVSWTFVIYLMIIKIKYILHWSICENKFKNTLDYVHQWCNRLNNTTMDLKYSWLVPPTWFSARDIISHGATFCYHFDISKSSPAGDILKNNFPIITDQINCNLNKLHEQFKIKSPSSLQFKWNHL